MIPVKEQNVATYVAALASTAAVPGGGSAAALAAAMGVALVSMVAKISAKKAKQDSDRAALMALVPGLDQLCERLMDLSQQDVDAYRAVIETKKAGGGPAEMERAYERAAEVPLAAAAAASEGLATAAEVSKHAWEMTASDLAVGTELLETGMHGALGNVAINLPELKGEAAVRVERKYQELRAAADR
jgi:methenyltetrahydrofolate cyclohydrolase